MKETSTTTHSSTPSSSSSSRVARSAAHFPNPLGGAAETTEIKVAVATLVHQNVELFQRLDREDKFLHGSILAPAHCGIQAGKGNDEFLFTGRMRLGQARLRCAPFYKDWLRISAQAECVYN